MKLKKLLSLTVILSILCTFLSFNFGFIVNAETEYTEGYYTYTVKNGEATITKCDTSISGDVTIPETLGGYLVTKIERLSFCYCDDITSLYIPENIECIGNGAFYRCSGLEKISLPFVGDKIGSIEHFAYIFCEYSQENADIFIEEPWKYVPKNLKDVIIYGEVKTIEEKAFLRCKIDTMTLSKSIITIEESAFYGCSLSDVYYVGNEYEWANINIKKYNFGLSKAILHYTYSDTECEEHTYLSGKAEHCGVCGKEKEKTEITSKPTQNKNSNTSKPNDNKTSNDKDKNKPSQNVNSTVSKTDNTTTSKQSNSQNTNDKNTENLNSVENSKEDEDVIDEQNNGTDSTQSLTDEENDTLKDTQNKKSTNNGKTLLIIIITALAVVLIIAIILFVLYKKGIIGIKK